MGESEGVATTWLRGETHATREGEYEEHERQDRRGCGRGCCPGGVTPRTCTRPQKELLSTLYQPLQKLIGAHHFAASVQVQVPNLPTFLLPIPRFANSIQSVLCIMPILKQNDSRLGPLSNFILDRAKQTPFPLTRNLGEGSMTVENAECKVWSSATLM
jgi:hypothetical protein